MTGFKDGAASDSPFGGEDEADDQEESISGGVDTEAEAEKTSTASESASSVGLPWLYQRNSITDGREKTGQLHLQQSTLNVQRGAKADVEQELGESVRKADLREASLLVGLHHVEETVVQLREWGYDFE